MSDTLAPARDLWLELGLPEKALSNLQLSEKPDPAVNSSFKLGTAAQTSIGLSALAAAHFHELGTGVEQTVSVDARHAILEFKSESWYTLDGALPADALFDDLAGLYKTKDDSYVRLHTNFPHHRQGILDILRCAPTKPAVAVAVREWNAVDLEDEAAKRGMVATALRSFDAWDAHPQGLALVGVPPVQIVNIGDAPRRQVGKGGHGEGPLALEGIRVLDLTRVLAGPVCGRTLAAHGADVLLVTSPSLPALPFLDADTSRGKRTTQLDLTAEQDRATLAALAQDADVFLQAYRPGGLATKGFAPKDVAQARPGIVYASLRAYGWEGPWQDRRGFDSLVQTASGFNVAEAEAYAAFTHSTVPLIPKALPMQALDHAAGYLLAFGINAALCKTVTEGGSWEVRVSLAAVGHWIHSLGRVPPEVAFGDGLPLPPRMMPVHPEIEGLSRSFVQSAGDRYEDPQDRESRRMTAIGHAGKLSATPVREAEAPIVLNAHQSSWLQRP